MSVAATVRALPKPAQVAIAIGGALAIGAALYYAARFFGLLDGTSAIGATTPAPVETAPSAPVAGRTVVGTDSTGAPVYGTGTSADKSPAAIARRTIASAGRLTK